MRLLAGVLSLHDADDVEALIARAVERSGHIADLRPHERDDLIAWLLGEVWRASLTFDKTRGTFSTYAYTVAQRRIVDWIRQERGRTRWKFAGGVEYVRERPTVVSFDHERDRLDETVAARVGDLEDGWDLDLERLLEGGDRTRAADLAILGLEAPRRAA